jgi:hypothetical protein
METSDLNSYGRYIGSIIIGVVFIIGLIIIIDELISVSKFCYRYTYLYNYGKANETTCMENKLEYERARFKIYNEIPNYKFNKDVFNKSWINYVYYITVFILSILMCIAFGYLFHNFFIEGNQACSTNDPNDITNWSFLKVLMKCFCGTCHEYIPNCFVNYTLLFIIIIIYPLTLILKLVFKIDFTTASNGTMSKFFHICVFILLVYYILIIYVEKSDSTTTYDKYMKILIYVIYLSIFYANNYLFNKTFDEYKTIGAAQKAMDTTTFFDIYKQEEPVKPSKVPEPPQLKTFKYCNTANFQNKNNKYCYQIDRLQTYPEINTNNPFYNCLDSNIKTKVQGFITDRKFYEADKIIVEEYYKQLKKYEDDLKKYNFKHNIYMNNKTEFPEIVYFLYHMCPKLLGLHKSEIQLLFILIIILILLTYYLKTINNRYGDYLYYTAFIYIIGLLSISILVNAVLNYNTYANKYLIYEPTHNYKNLMNNKHTALNIMISRDNKLKDLFKIYTDKYNDKINSVNLTERPSKFSSGMSLDKFIAKIRKSITADTNDNINNPTRETRRNQSLLHLQIQFYKTIYSYMIKNEDVRLLYPAIRVTDKYIESVTQGDPDNYNRFNNYKTSLISGKYIEKPTSTTQPSSIYINQEYVYFFSLIRRVFVSTELNIKVKLKQLRLNYEYLIYNTTDKNYNDIKTEINFVSFLDNTNYNENEITRTNNGEDAKNYDYNRSYIDNAFDIYGEFLKEFRLAIINLLTTTGISCQYTDYIEIQDKLQEYYNKMFSNAGSVKSIDKFVLKNTTQEPKIDIYRKVLELSIEQINSLMVKYMNIIKVYLKSFEVNPDVTPSADKLKTLQSADNKINMVAEKIKNNFNVFNKEYNRHTNDSLLKMNFRIDSNYKPSKYEKFTSADMKKLNISTDNVSWSFIILIIIFAIILIEPTLI